jgi:hypothetical protein
MPISAIITGDIVASTHLQKPLLKELLRNLQMTFSSFQYEFFRGDSFQVYVKEATDAFPLLLKIRVLAMKAAAKQQKPVSDIRASIGIGYVKQPLKTISTATDEAFVLSGRLFEKLAPPGRLLIASPEQNAAANSGFRLIALFTDFIFSHMTVKQAEVVHELLQKKNQQETAKILRKTQVTIHKLAQAAEWPTLEKLMSEYKKLTDTLT